MRFVKGDIWAIDCDVICITTNGYVRGDGKAVMGRGVAYQATQRYPDIARLLGNKLIQYGNVVSIIRVPRTPNEKILCSFPVKHHWHDQADIHLIKKSAEELLSLAREWSNSVFVLPRPGCGNGKLGWEDVLPVLVATKLPDNVIVVEYDKGVGK